MTHLQGLLHGMVFQTNVESFTGKYLYSDYAYADADSPTGKLDKDSMLNKAARIPFVGILAGVATVALSLIHILDHTFMAYYTGHKGNWYHAAKGLCEMLRGGIVALPVVGRIFANLYSGSLFTDNIVVRCGNRSWWMIKIHNPEKLDDLDIWMCNWVDFPECYKVNFGSSATTIKV